MTSTNSSGKYLITEVNLGFTLIEACEYMKQRDKNPTDTSIHINWYNAKTGKPITIGYSK